MTTRRIITMRRSLLAGVFGAIALAFGILSPQADAQVLTTTGQACPAFGFPLNPGAQCYRIDTRTAFIWDGAAWQQVVTIATTGGAQATDYQMFINGVDACFDDNAAATALVKTRNATGDWGLQRTAAGAETHNIECSFGFPTRTTASKGVNITAVSIVHSIGVVALTSATFQGMQSTTYTNNAAPVVANYAGSVSATLPTATQAQPYVTATTIPTPVFMNTANAQITIDWQVVMANTGVYQVRGLIVTYTEIPL